MDSFLLLRRLVAAIVFKGQTVSDYWWSRRTIFLTKPDKKLSGILGARGDIYCLGQRVLSCMMRVVVNLLFLFFSQLQQAVEWVWPGRREPDDEH